MSSSHCVLGIDIGTTSVKCCLVDVATKEVVSSQKKDTCSDVPSELGNYSVSCVCVDRVRLGLG